MVKIIALFFLVLSNGYAASFIRFLNESPNGSFRVASSGDTTTNPKYGVRIGSGNGTAISSPTEIYFPGNGSETISGDIIYTGTPRGLRNSSGDSDKLFIDLEIEHDKANDHRLIFAVRDGSDSTFKIVGSVGSDLVAGSDVRKSILATLSFSTICSKTSDIDCTKFEDSSSATSDSVIGMFYLCDTTQSCTVSETAPAIEDLTDPSPLFVQIKISNDAPDVSVVPVLESLGRGDERILVNYSVAEFSAFSEVMIIGGKSSGLTGDFSGLDVQTAVAVNGASFIKADDSFKNTGSTSATVKKVAVKTSASIIDEGTFVELENGEEYRVGLTAVNLYGLTTPVSSTDLVTPEDIVDLLKKNQCYLLTAGFGGDHPVVTYFRNFRDQVLNKYWLGKKFIQAYYFTAPKFARTIYQSPTLSFIIRNIAYLIKFILENLILISISTGIILALTGLKKFVLDLSSE